MVPANAAPVSSSSALPVDGSAPVQDLVLRRDEGAVAVLVLNRPKALNALNQPLLHRLNERVVEVGQDPAVRAVILMGSGDRAFVAGADIAEMAGYRPEQAEFFARAGQDILNKLAALDKPVIAAVHGFALGGGCELAIACDFIIASHKAKFGLPEVTLGVIPGFGGTQRLSRLIGRQQALRWILTGDIHTAEQALAVGLLTQVVEPEQLLATALDVATRIASRGPLAIAAARRCVDAGLDGTLAQGQRREAIAFGRLFASSDQKEGMSAFVEKRAAKFTGQ